MCGNCGCARPLIEGTGERIHTQDAGDTAMHSSSFEASKQGECAILSAAHAASTNKAADFMGANSGSMLYWHAGFG